MRARGACWLALAEALDRPAARVPAATRPAPRPPVGQRPARLSVTEIRTLIRDPYAIYARHVLRLRPLDPLRPEPDARMRGTVLHRIVETYTRRRLADPAAGGAALLEAIAAGVLDERVPWAVVRTLWLARVRRMAAWFPAYEAALPGLVVLTEADGRFAVGPDGFVLTGRPDRIDRRPDGTLGIIDWKTGEPPSAPQQQRLEKQLLLLAIMAEAGAFGPAAAGRVGAATYVRLADTREVVTADVSPESLAATLSGLVALVARYADPAQGYIARRAMMKADDAGDYDHLARFGEWDVTEASLAQVVGREGGDA
jgi:RecB family exonuclease